MSEPPPRKRFQIHLSTAIVMMFVAGGLVWANFTVRRHPLYPNFPDGIAYNELADIWSRKYGWPFHACIVLPNRPRWEYFGGRLTNLKSIEVPPEILYMDASLNLLTALAILFAVWFLCECLIRRHRAARTPQ